MAPFLIPLISTLPSPIRVVQHRRFLMSDGGCTVSDLWDRKLDVQVERTRDRSRIDQRIVVSNRNE